MKRKILKRTMFTFLYLLGAFILFVFLYLMFSPQIGGKNVGYDSSPNFENGKFNNLVHTALSTGDAPMWKSMYEFFFQKHEDAFPRDIIQTEKVDMRLLESLKEGQVAVTWLGHSTTLIKTKEVTILTDPMLSGKRIPPLHMGPKPFPYSENYTVENLPQVDVVLISHDHYDHLDMETIKKLKQIQKDSIIGIDVNEIVLKAFEDALI
jgi:hypothetical protein